MSLQGVRIAVTRAAAQARELGDPLSAAGAQVFICPLIRVQAMKEAGAGQRIAQSLDAIDWLVFTSSNGVEQFMELLAEAAVDAAVLRDKQIACVGSATAAALARHGLRAAALPNEFVGSAVARAMLSRGNLQGKRVLLARAAGGGRALPDELSAQGAIVEDLQLYTSVLDEAGAAALAALLSDGRVDLITFTAGSAVTYFVQAVGSSREAAVAVIGPSTAEVARRHGVRVDIEANPHTTTGLVNAIQDYYAARRGHWRSNAE